LIREIRVELLMFTGLGADTGAPTQRRVGADFVSPHVSSEWLAHAQ